MTRCVEMDAALPNGYWNAGSCIREARVHGIPEGDEELAAELSTATLPIERASALLARCVTLLGNSDCRRSDAVRELSLGDREALLLHIRRLTFGEEMRCVLRCPACSKAMEFELRVADLLQPLTEARQQAYEEDLVAGGTRFRVKFRLPTAADLEKAIHAAHGALEEATHAVLLSCVDWVRREEEPEQSNLAPAAWPPELAAQITARIAELDPQAEIRLQLTCPACTQTFPTSLDTADYLLREFATRERRLYQEVHCLALAYHWSEVDILRMTPQKRKLYLEMLAGEGQ